MKFDFDFEDSADGAIDLTSLIDVLFLLLIFFILAATFTAPSIDVALSKAKTATSSNPNERVTFSINASGEIFHNKDKIELSAVTSIFSGLNEDTPVVFNVDKDAPFDAFITLMDEVKGIGYSKFLINAEPAGENK